MAILRPLLGGQKGVSFLWRPPVDKDGGVEKGAKAAVPFRLERVKKGGGSTPGESLRFRGVNAVGLSTMVFSLGLSGDYTGPES